MDTKIICECGHSKDNHGIQSGCAQCQCVKSQSSVMVTALSQRVADLEAALEEIKGIVDRSEPVKTHPVTGEEIGRRPNAQKIVDVANAALAKGAS
jgi:hypothetical protein